MHRIRKFALSIVSLLLATSSSSLLADHSWGAYHWARQNNPFTLQVIDSVTSFWWSELDESLTKWSVANSLELQVTQSETDETTRMNCPMVVGKVRICNGAYGTTGWLGLATVGVDSTGHVDRGVSRINDSYSSYWGSESMKNHVVCHEIGHLFGLGHTSEDGSVQSTCMDYSSSSSSQWPNGHDYDLLDNSIHAHLDSHNSYNDSLDGTSGGGDTGGGDTGGGTGDGGTTDGGGTTEECSGNGADKDCNGIPDHKEGGSTDDGSDSPCTTKGNGRKKNSGCYGADDNNTGSKLDADTNGNSWVSHLPPLGTRVAQTRRGEVWVSSREDGGLWIHHVYLVEENVKPNRGQGNDNQDHGAHSH